MPNTSTNTPKKGEVPKKEVSLYSSKDVVCPHCQTSYSALFKRGELCRPHCERCYLCEQVVSTQGAKAKLTRRKDGTVFFICQACKSNEEIDE